MDADDEELWTPIKLVNGKDMSTEDVVLTIFKATQGELGLKTGFFSSGAQAAAEGEKFGIAGSVNIMLIDNTTHAIVGDALINQKAGYAAGDVNVSAYTKLQSVNFAGSIKNIMEGAGEVDDDIWGSNAGKAGIGASYAGMFYGNDTQAIVQGGKIDAKNLNVEAKVEGFDVVIAVAGGKGGKLAFNGSAVSTKLRHTTIAKIDDATVVDASKLVSVLATDSYVNIHIAGAFSKSENTAIGASVTISDIERETLAFIGNRLDEDGNLYTGIAGTTDDDETLATTAGLVQADEGVVISSTSNGLIFSIALAGAHSEDAKPSGSDSLGAGQGKTKTSTSQGQGGTGVGISGDVAINDITDRTHGYMNGNTRVEAGQGDRANNTDLYTPYAGTVPSVWINASNETNIHSNRRCSCDLNEKRQINRYRRFVCR